MSVKRKKILLWADARVQCPNSNSSSSRGHKRKAADLFGLTSKCQQIESEVDDVVADSKKKRGDKYTLPQLRSWARCIVLGNQDSTDEPPDLPPITGNGPKNQKSNHLVMHLLKLPAPSLLKLFVDLKLNNLVMCRLLFLEARLKHLLSSALVREIHCALSRKGQSCEVKSCKN